MAYFPVDPFNPYQGLFYRGLEEFEISVVPDARFKLTWLVHRRREVDVLHIHWPQAFYRVRRRPRWMMRRLSIFKFAYFVVRLAAARAMGYRLVWTIHQVYPHEIKNERLDRMAPIILGRACHAFIAHDDHTASLAKQELDVPDRKLHVIPHPSYVGAYPDQPTQGEARRILGIDDGPTLFLCFGGLRKYKNVELLLEAFATLRCRNVMLVLAGRPADRQLAKQIETAAAGDERIRPMPMIVSDEEVPTLFAAADAAVLPRSDGGTSGALILAVGMGLPVIAARGSANEAITRGEEAAWLFHPGDVTSLRSCLQAAATEPEARRRKAASAARISAQLGPSSSERLRAALVISGQRSGRRRVLAERA